MKSLKRQVILLSLLMIVVFMVLSLCGLELFGKGNFKPSSWLKSDKDNNYEQIESDSTISLLSATLDNTLKSSSVLPSEISSLPIASSNGNYASMFKDRISIRNNQGVEVTVDLFVLSIMSGYIAFVPKDFPHPGYDVESIVYSGDGIKTVNVLEGNFVTANYAGGVCPLNSGTAEFMYNLVPKPSKPLPPTPSKEGHTFVGWYYDEALTQPYNGEPIYENITLYAKFDINRHVVTLDTNGGAYCDSITVDWNTVPTLPTPTRVGYDFIGWYDGETEYNHTPVKSDKTFIARWKIKTFTVSFIVDGEKYVDISVDYGTTLAEAMNEAGIASYYAVDADGDRLSKLNSIVTEDSQVFVKELSGWEKYGDFVACNHWYTWLMCCVIGVLLVVSIVGIVLFVKRR